MQITETAVRQIKLEGLMTSHSLHPIDITIENFEPGKGRITIRCWNKAWASYWGGMASRGVEEFFCSCDEHYLAGCLAPGLPHDRYSPELTAQSAKREVLKRRRDFVRGLRSEAPALDPIEARKLWARIGDEIEEAKAFRILPDVFGHEEWWGCTESEPHPEYKYLCRVILAGQEGLRMAANQSAEAGG